MIKHRTFGVEIRRLFAGDRRGQFGQDVCEQSALVQQRQSARCGCRASVWANGPGGGLDGRGGLAQTFPTNPFIPGSNNPAGRDLRGGQRRE